jgi:uncharacterized oligopeptide transporter (OPT) family protein
MVALRSHGREIYDVLRAATPTHRRLRGHLGTIATATVLVAAVCTLAALVLERNAPHTEVRNVGDAAFWVSTQLLTVSSSLRNPVTTGGKLLDVAMEVYAITVVAALAGAFASFLQRRGVEREERARIGS